ncbi:hypothetical protein [Segetibacter sp.]|uniref:hypothetical protein n=1 Tax=Segetibacter sp. TaxID=2231182 RepID=UPI00261792DD|nr:hypothetical protein [Segetibacter sp.]MCW3080196.1 hypothetical protein [Segetibacter sp.]
MKAAARWKKVVVWAASIIAVLALIGVGTWYSFKKDIQFGDSKAKPVIAKEIKKLVTEISDSLYNVGFSNFDFNIDSGYASISNLKMSVDTGIYRKLVAEKKVTNNIIAAKADKITISKFGLKKIEGEQTLHITKMQIENLIVHITNKVRSYNDTAHSKSFIATAMKSLFKTVDTDNIIEMKIENMFLNNTTLVYTNKNENKTKTTRLRNLDISLTNLSTGALANKANNQKNVAVINVGHQKVVTTDKLYDIDFHNMRIISAERKVPLLAAVILALLFLGYILEYLFFQYSFWLFCLNQILTLFLQTNLY